MLQRSCHDDMSRVPVVVESVEMIPPSTVDVAMAICSKGCLQSQGFANMLSDVSAQGATMLPVVVEAAFRFPAKTEMASLLQGDGGPPAEEYAQILTLLFSKIAVDFQPQYQSLNELEVKSADIARRIAK